VIQSELVLTWLFFASIVFTLVAKVIQLCVNVERVQTDSGYDEIDGSIFLLRFSISLQVLAYWALASRLALAAAKMPLLFDDLESPSTLTSKNMQKKRSESLYSNASNVKFEENAQAFRKRAKKYRVISGITTVAIIAL